MSKKLGTLVKKARTENGFTQEELAKKVDGLSAADIGKIERGEKEPETAVIRNLAKALGVTQVSLVSAASGSGKSTSAKTTASKTTAAKTAASKTTASKTAASKTAASKTTASKTAASKTTASKTAASKTTASKTTASKTAAAKKTTASKAASGDLKLTATEKKLVQAYRKADSDTKKAALGLLEGKATALELAAAMLSAKAGSEGKADKDSSGLENLIGSLLGGKSGSSSSSKDPISQLIENTLGNLGKS